MLDEFGDISVVETEAVEVASVEPAIAVPVAAPEFVPEALPSEVEATQINLDPADDVLKNNSQQVYNELMGRLNESGTAITAAGIDAKQKEQEEKRNESFEHAQEQMRREEARQEWLTKDHDFGGMKMSGADLEKMMNFISNPAMQDKLRERLGKSGMSKDKADKGMKELNEYIDLKKKEQEGKLTDEEQRRLKEINKSEEFKATTAAVAEQARENGIVFEKNSSAEVIKAQTNNVYTTISNERSAISIQDNNSRQNSAEHEKQNSARMSSLAAYAHFATAPNLADEFTTKVGGSASAPVPIANNMNTSLDTTTPAAVVAQAQVKPKAIDLSFG